MEMISSTRRAAHSPGNFSLVPVRGISNPSAGYDHIPNRVIGLGNAARRASTDLTE
jgi:hypothetical protein